MVLTFGQIVEAAPGQLVIEDQAAITMSPSQMKVFAHALANAVEAYERTFGKITMREEVGRPKMSAEAISKQMEAKITSASEKPQRALRSRGAAKH